jgi:hypothetical protein
MRVPGGIGQHVFHDPFCQRPGALVLFQHYSDLNARGNSSANGPVQWHLHTCNGIYSRARRCDAVSDNEQSGMRHDMRDSMIKNTTLHRGLTIEEPVETGRELTVIHRFGIPRQVDRVVGMPVEDRIIRAGRVPDEIEETGAGFRGVGGFELDPLLLPEKAHCLHPFRGGQAVFTAEVIMDDALRADGDIRYVR